MTTRNVDVLIIGAGIVGLSLAYELVRAGARVTVVEARDLCQGSSALNAGGVRRQFSSEINIRCALGTMAMVERMEREFGIDLRFRKAGYLFVCATLEQEARLRLAVARQNQLGANTRMVAPADMTSIAPGLNVDDVRGGAWGPDDGYLDPRALLRGYAAIAKKAGATILPHHPATALRAEKQRVVSIVAGDVRFSAGVIVNACGVWAPRIAQLYGATLPITARRSSLWIARPKAGAEIGWLPQIIDLETRTFFHADVAGDGSIVFGVGGADLVEDTPDIPCNWDRLPDAKWRMEHRYPKATGSVIERGWAGFIETTDDDNPIVGWTHFDNLYTAAGLSGHGMSIAPGLAAFAAAEILGATPETSLEAFRLERFIGGCFERETMFGASSNLRAARM